MAVAAITFSGCSPFRVTLGATRGRGGSPEPNNRRAGEAPKTLAVWNAKRRLPEG